MLVRWKPYILLLLLGGWAHAQDEAADPPTLPPTVVRPETPENTAPPPLDTDFTPAPAPESDFNLDLNFPDLSGVSLGGFDPFAEDGILRTPQTLLNTPAAASVRTRQEIAERQAVDMFEALQNEVGVLMQRTAAGQSSPFMRGLTGQQVLILVDGIRMNNSFFRRGPNQYFNTIDPGMVERIETLRGQGSVMWGSDAIGGAINVVTRGANSHWGMHHGDYLTREFSQSFGSANSSSNTRLNVEGWVGQTGFFGGGGFLNVRDLDTGFDNISRQPGTNYQQYSGDIKFNHLLDENRMLTLSLQHLEQENLPRSDRFPGYPQDLNNSNSLNGARFFDPQQRDLAYLRYRSLGAWDGFWDAVTMTASYHRQKETQTRGVPEVRFQETNVETTGVNIVGVRDLDRFGKWTIGADWYHDDIDSAFGGTASGVIVPDDAWYRRLGGFVNWEVALTERLGATAGLRYETIETAGTPEIGGTPVFINPDYSDWVGQFGLNYKLQEGLHLVGSISEGFRAPNLDDLMANNPNVLQAGQSLPSLGLRPEKSTNYELGLKTNFERLRTQTFVYWLDIEDNMVSIDAGPNTFATANQDSFVQGVEFNGEYRLLDEWSMYGNFWYTYGKNLVTDAPLSRVPPMQGILGLRYRALDQRRSLALYTWMSDRQDRLDTVRDITDERIPVGGTPGFATLNLRAQQILGAYDQHRFTLSLENLTDKGYLVHGSGVLGPGFNARLGYSWVY